MKKPYLFYRTIEDGVVFVDMRYKTSEQPTIYLNFNKYDTPIWKKIRVERDTLKNLEGIGEYQFWSQVDDSDFFDACEDDKDFDKFYYLYNGLFDGYCKVCGVDFKGNSYHCSDKCRDTAYKRHLAAVINEANVCEICKKKIIYCSVEVEDVFGIKLPKTKIPHHIQYNPEIKMTVCAQCHGKIHHSNDPEYEPYRPKDKPKDKRSRKETVWQKCELKYTKEYWAHLRKGS